MTTRRINIGKLKKVDDKVVAESSGLAGEDFDAEVYQLHGFSSNPSGSNESVVVDMNGDSDNFLALPPCGHKEAASATTVVYYGDTEIILDENSILIKVGGNFLNIKEGLLSTDLQIETSEDVVAGGISLRNHTHPYFWTDPGGASDTSSPS